MSATDELRRMLDERGVKWTKPSGLNERYANELTFIGDHAVVSEIDGSDLLRINFDGTPEQAIAATLGAGTCHVTVQDNMAETDGMGDVWLECDACRWQMPLEPSTPRFNFCPNCGAKVVDE